MFRFCMDAKNPKNEFRSEKCNFLKNFPENLILKKYKIMPHKKSLH